MNLLKDQRSFIDSDTDCLNQTEALNTLLTAAREIKPPACIALYGSWGSGKTALMHSAYEHLNHNPVQYIEPSGSTHGLMSEATMYWPCWSLVFSTSWAYINISLPQNY